MSFSVQYRCFETISIWDRLITFFYLAGEVRFIDYGAQLRFEANHSKTYDIYTNFARRAQPANADGDQVSGPILPLNTLSDTQTSLKNLERSSQEEEPRSDFSISLFDNNTTAETRSRRQNKLLQNQWNDYHLKSSPGRLLLPERDLSRLQIASKSPFHWIKSFDSCQCACLMLFFVEKVAPHVRYESPTLHSHYVVQFLMFLG